MARRYRKDPIAAWEKQPKRVLHSSNSSVGRRLLEAKASHEALEITYAGGSEPHQARMIRPKQVFERGGADYVEAYCVTKKEHRIFRLDKITIRAAGTRGQNATSPGSAPKDWVEDLAPIAIFIVIVILVIFFL